MRKTRSFVELNFVRWRSASDSLDDDRLGEGRHESGNDGVVVVSDDMYANVKGWLWCA